MTLLLKSTKELAIYSRFLVGIFLVLSLASPIFAAPITLDTGLPIAEGEGIFRIQTKYTSATEDPSSQDRKLTVREVPIVLGYGVTEKTAFFGIVPYVDKELNLTSGGESITRKSSGVGDVTFVTRYTAWKSDKPGQTLRVAPFAGIEVPTGEDAKEDSLGRLPQLLQPGSGSWDPFLGIILTSQTLERQIDASASYAFNTEANDFKFGDMARFDISYQHRLWPRELPSGVPAFVYGVLEGNLIWQDENEVNGVKDRDSGGTTFYVAPGIQYVTKRMVAEAAVQIPVLQELNGDALRNDFVGILSLRVNF